MTISRERIEKFNVVTDVLDKILREEDIKRLRQELGMPQESTNLSKEQQLENIVAYLNTQG